MSLAPWEHMLDEFAIQPDPMTWYKVVGLRFQLEAQHEAVEELKRRGFVERAGVTRDEWIAELYRITPAGREHWEQNVKGQRRRPPGADPVPKYSTAQMAAATGPREVFDLPRVPWTWDGRGEYIAEFGEAPCPKPYKRRKPAEPSSPLWKSNPRG